VHGGDGAEPLVKVEAMVEVKAAVGGDPGAAVPPVQDEGELLQPEVQGLQEQGHLHRQLHQGLK
jgi:hypothetical protein